MMKIKMFESNSIVAIETKINNFIKEQCLSIDTEKSKFNIVDIKFSSTVNNQGRRSILVLMLYESNEV